MPRFEQPQRGVSLPRRGIERPAFYEESFMQSGHSNQATCRRWHQVLHASHIEAPDVEFVVQFVKFGTQRQPARQCEVKVLARTTQGALKICKSQVKRAEQFAVVSQQARLTVPA
jgi:hypothetical protein